MLEIVFSQLDILASSLSVKILGAMLIDLPYVRPWSHDSAASNVRTEQRERHIFRCYKGQNLVKGQSENSC